MEYVVQAFKVLKSLVHAEANARAHKTGLFVAFLTQSRFPCVITNLFECMFGFVIVIIKQENV